MTYNLQKWNTAFWVDIYTIFLMAKYCIPVILP